MFAVFCYPKVARQVPTNYILLSLFTVTEAYMVSFICMLSDHETVLMAAIMTAAMTLALTLYACTTKTDITYYGGALFIGSCALFLLLIFCWFY